MRTTFLLLAMVGIAACTTETVIVRREPTDPATAPSGSETPGGDEEPAPADDEPVSAAKKDTGAEPPSPPGSKDGGTTPPPPPLPDVDEGRVHCGTSAGVDRYCPAGQVCCVQNAVKQLAPIVLTCDTYQGCQGRPDPVPLTCDGPEDCKPGEHCFAIATTSMALASLCGATPISSSWQRLCNPDASGECEAGQTCVPTTSAPALGVCR